MVKYEDQKKYEKEKNGYRQAKTMDYRIVESPESCARMKAAITDELNECLLKEKPPDLQNIQAAKVYLKLISGVEKLFKIDRNLNVKELLEQVQDMKTYGCLDNKPNWEANCKIKMKI